MATWYLINNVQFGTNFKIAGELVDDVQEDVTALRNAGAVLAPSSNATIATAAALALQKKLSGGTPEACEAIMQAALDVSQEMKEATPVADATALAAIPAVLRANGMQAVKLDDDTLWTFDSGSAAAASTWVIVPAAGTGRWLRKDQVTAVVHAAVADATALAAIAATDRADGMRCVKLDDSSEWIFDADSAVAASTWVIVPAAGTGRWLLVGGIAVDGLPMVNRLRLLGAPGAAVAGNTVTIGTTVYEFRGDTPPSGGTAGRIWVYNGADSAASRANLIKAINTVVDAAVVTRNGVASPAVKAIDGVTTGDIIVYSATTSGGDIVPSATALATTETLDTATDIWDGATMGGGRLRAPRKRAHAAPVTLAAAHIAKATFQFVFDFTPTRAIVINRMRPQNEAWTITGNMVSITLAGGASPNNQPNDVLECWASE